MTKLISPTWQSLPLAHNSFNVVKAPVGGLLHRRHIRSERLLSGASLPAIALSQVAAAVMLVASRRTIRRACETVLEKRPPSAAVKPAVQLSRIRSEVVEARNGCQHTCTIIYLHAFASKPSEYLMRGQCLPWLRGGDRASRLRAVLPAADRLRQPWGLLATSWYSYITPRHNHVGDLKALAVTRRRLEQIIRSEIARLHGDGHRVFLGGLSQGCAVALDTYVRLAPKYKLGGFVGSVGFFPSDKMGFKGSSKALEALIASKEQACRPVWLQCAVDDHWTVPWRTLVAPSLSRAKQGLPGLCLRNVSGREHAIDDWEVHFLNDFMRKHANFAYA